VDACGLKGSRVNGAAISETHANFIVNAGGATASDVRRLAERARAAVAERFGVELVYEVQFMGDWSDWPTEVP
jgi:UDP-N-acetylmuramate dehydrogenase